MKPLLLVGVDPGLTIGCAALTVEGQPILVASFKGLSLNGLVEKLTQAGIILAVATDVIKIPQFTLKLAKSLRVPLIKPTRPFSYRKKKEIVRKFAPELKLKNKHEVAALFAALHAFKQLRPLIEKVKRKRLEPAIEAKVLLMLLKGQASNLRTAIIKAKGLSF